MLEAYLSFEGPTGKILNFLGNDKAIEAPQVTRLSMGKYMITFLSGRQLQADQIANSIVMVQCQGPSGSGTITNVSPSPQATYNPNAPNFPWTISVQVETLNVVLSLAILGSIVTPTDRPVVSVSFIAKNIDLRNKYLNQIK